MQIRPVEIDVDDNDPLAQSREHRREIRCDEGLADPALTTANGEESRTRSRSSIGSDHFVYRRGYPGRPRRWRRWRLSRSRRCCRSRRGREAHVVSFACLTGSNRMRNFLE